MMRRIMDLIIFILFFELYTDSWYKEKPHNVDIMDAATIMALRRPWLIYWKKTPAYQSAQSYLSDIRYIIVEGKVNPINCIFDRYDWKITLHDSDDDDGKVNKILIECQQLIRTSQYSKMPLFIQDSFVWLTLHFSLLQNT